MAEDQPDRKLLESVGIQPLVEHSGVRRLPGPVDVLLYPASLAGLIHVAAAVLYVIGIAVGRRWVPALGRGSGRLSLVAFVPVLYFTWYLAECIYDSARGGIRAPGILTTNPGLSDAASRIAYLVATSALYVLPPILYALYVRRVDGIFWSLTAWAALFAPIGLLAMVVQDSSDALNPLFLLGSMARTLVPYLGLLLLVTGFAGVVWIVLRYWVLPGGSVWLRVAGLVIMAYGALVLAHELGRFYWRYRERLDWGL